MVDRDLPGREVVGGGRLPRAARSSHHPGTVLVAVERLAGLRESLATRGARQLPLLAVPLASGSAKATRQSLRGESNFE